MTTQVDKGSMALAEGHLINTLADSAVFRRWCGADQSVQARNKIHRGIIPPPPNGKTYSLDEIIDLRPYVIIATPGVRLTRTTATSYKDRGELILKFVESIPQEWYEDPGRAELSFKRGIGEVLDDLMTYPIDDPGAGPYLVIDEIRMDDEPQRIPDKEILTQGDHQMWVVTFYWGGGAED